jgi:protein arginine N-methyltransferase 1
MLNDKVRNGVMESSIRDANLTGKTVLEIGSGAGLTAIFLARHGARHVTTCEINPQLFAIASRVIAQSEYKNRITIINKSSSVAIDDGDVDFVPDLIFTETIDCGVVDEGFYSIANDIGRIAGDDTKILPQRIRQFGALVDCEGLHELNAVGVVSGVDLNMLNDHRTSHYFPVRSHLYRVTALTMTTFLRTYHYRSARPRKAKIQFQAHSDGWCHGMLSYFDAHFGEYIVSNDVSTASHWHQAFHPLENPIKMQSGLRYQFGFSSNGQMTLME